LCFCLPGGSPRRSRAVHTASGWRLLCVLSHLFTTIDELGMSVFMVMCDNLGYGRLFVTRTIFINPRAVWAVFCKIWQGFSLFGVQILYDKLLCKQKICVSGVGVRICACAHNLRKKFLQKNSFSPEGKFLQKNYVVLYCVKCINICVRRCVYAHMRTGLPDSVFFCLHNFLISQWWFCDAGDLSF